MSRTPANRSETLDSKATYYDQGGIDTLAIIKSKLTQAQFEGYLLGQSLKYLSRVNFKHTTKGEQRRDIEKARFYADQLIKSMDISIAQEKEMVAEWAESMNATPTHDKERTIDTADGPKVSAISANPTGGIIHSNQDQKI